MNRYRILPAFIFFLFLCILILLGGKMGITKPLVDFGEKITVPVRLGIYQTWQNILKKINQSDKIDILQKEVKQLSVDNVQLNILKEENKALRKQLEVPLPANMQFIPAKTLGLIRYLTIDKGENDGLKIGMTVVSENILVGKIISLTPKTAQIIIPTDSDSKIPVKTLKMGARGLLIGQFGTKTIMDKVLQAEGLEADDLVVTTGENDYARDLIIGKLGRIEKKEVEPFQKGEVLPLLDYSRLENIFVIK